VSEPARLRSAHDSATGELRVRVFRGRGVLDEIEHVYRYLWSRTAVLPPTLDFDWVRVWWDLHQADGRLFIVLLQRAGRPLALAPLYIRRREASTRGLLRTVCFLGTGENDADEVFGTNTGWLGAAEYHGELNVAVADALRRHRGAWDRLWFSNVGPNTGLVEQLPRALGATLLTAERRNTCNWVIDLPESRDAYVAGLAKRSRNNMRRVLRDADAAGLQYEWITSAEPALRAFEQLAELHSRQWQARGKPGACASDTFLAFHRQLLPRYARQGRLWLLRISCQGRPVVLSYDIAAGRRVYGYITGADPEFSRLSGGKLSLLKVMERAIALGFESYDLLSGNYGYKHRLTDRQMPIATLEAYGRTPAARAWLALRGLSRKVRGGVDPRAAEGS